MINIPLLKKFFTFLWLIFFYNRFFIEISSLNFSLIFAIHHKNIVLKYYIMAENKQDLNRLFNQKIVSVTSAKRKMASSGSFKIPFVSHQGNLVTTESGSSYLIHQGPNYGKAADCVITPASNMGSSWKTKGSTMTVTNNATVGDLMEAGQSSGRYGLFSNNCYSSQRRVREASGGSGECLLI